MIYESILVMALMLLLLFFTSDLVDLFEDYYEILNVGSVSLWGSKTRGLEVVKILGKSKSISIKEKMKEDDRGGVVPMKTHRAFYGDPVKVIGNNAFGKIMGKLGKLVGLKLGFRLNYKSKKLVTVKGSLKTKNWFKFNGYLIGRSKVYNSIIVENYSAIFDSWSSSSSKTIRNRVKGMVMGFNLLDPIFKKADKFYNYIGDVIGKECSFNPIRVNLDVP